MEPPKNQILRIMIISSYFKPIFTSHTPDLLRLMKLIGKIGGKTENIPSNDQPPYQIDIELTLFM